MRRTESIAILAVLALSLLGCRADNTPKEAEQPDYGKSVPAAEAPLAAPKSPATTVNDKRPLIVCFGDSATMRKYVHEKRARCPSILLRVKYRMAMTVVRKNSTTVKQHSPGG